MQKKFLLGILFSSLVATAGAQTDSLMNMLDGPATAQKKDAVTATFKATRIINGSSVENVGAGVLDFRISHRFGTLNQGAQNFFGLDNATMRIGLDYGITKWLMIGLGHNTLNKTDDGFAKIKLLAQKKGGMPVTVSYQASATVVTTPAPSIPSGDTYYFSNRLSYINQVHIARKFNDWISLQVSPTLVHDNLVDSTKFSNNTFAIGVGGRVKLSRRIAITGEYYYRTNNTNMLYNGAATYNAFSLGVDIETGGHVFQLMFTNSQGESEKAFITQTTDSWSKQAIHFGFNISRVFTVVKPKEFRGGEKGW